MKKELIRARTSCLLCKTEPLKVRSVAAAKGPPPASPASPTTIPGPSLITLLFSLHHMSSLIIAGSLASDKRQHIVIHETSLIAFQCFNFSTFNVQPPSLPAGLYRFTSPVQSTARFFSTLSQCCFNSIRCDGEHRCKCPIRKLFTSSLSPPAIPPATTTTTINCRIFATTSVHFYTSSTPSLSSTAHNHPSVCSSVLNLPAAFITLKATASNEEPARSSPRNCSLWVMC